jgi:putative DNA primase/helicase
MSARGDLSFVEAMLAFGCDPGGEPIIADGQLHRYRGPSDRPGKKNCWYVLYEHGGAFGSWRLGISETWHDGSRLTKEKKRHLQQQIQKARAEAEVEQQRRQAAAAEKAKKYWARAKRLSYSTEHPYLQQKDVRPYCARLLFGFLLTLPLYDPANGDIVSLQCISPTGVKRFLTNGRKKGCYCPISGSVRSEITQIGVAEGFSTSSTLLEITGIPIAIAFDCGNLALVAAAMRANHPNAEILVFADNDRRTQGNPGVTAGREAAIAVNGKVIIPHFPEANTTGSDFNDLKNCIGTHDTYQQILSAINAGIPSSFRLERDAVYKVTTLLEYRICSRLEVVGQTRNVDGADWGKLLRFKDGDGRPHEWAMPMSMLADAGIELRRRLLEEGLHIEPTDIAHRDLNEYLSNCLPVERARAVNRLGWHGKNFVLPNQVFGETQTERILFQSATAVSHVFNVRGSLAEWRKEVAEPCVGNSRLVFAISVAFAAPLIALTDAESGGFHLVGHSSLGKTTALRVGGSVCGGSDAAHGGLRQWRATSNGLESVAAMHCDMLLCLDEVSEIAPREAGAAAYMLSNGQGKARARTDGSARPAYAWRLLFLSSGEISLADKVREDDRQRVTAGQQVRVLDIPADAGAGMGLFEDIHEEKTSQDFADRLRAATQQFYGTAIREFLTKVVESSDQVTKDVRAARDKFVKEGCLNGADPQVYRAAQRFGLVAAAGEVAADFGITGWEKDTAIRATADCFAAWLTNRGHKGPAEIDAGIRQVRRFFILHGPSRFSIHAKGTRALLTASGSVVLNRAGFATDDYYFTYPEIFKAEIAKGYDSQTLIHALAELQLLVRDKNGKTTCCIWDPAIKKNTRLIVFRKTITRDQGEADEEEEEISRQARADAEGQTNQTNSQ